MDWALAIDRNREALLRIVAALSAMAGITSDEIVETLPRHLRDRILRLLRPAESAVRRLIVIAAREVKITLRVANARKRQPPNSVILGLDPRTRSVKPKPAADNRKTSCILRYREDRPELGTGPRAKDEALCSASRPPKTGIVYPPGYRPPAAHPDSGSPLTKEKSPQHKGGTQTSFPLLDPLKRFDTGARRRYATTIPRVRSFSDRSLPVYMRLPEPPARREPAPGDPLDASPVCRRLAALKRVLDNLDGEAIRLARWQARRDLRLQRKDHRPGRMSPMRPGWPPGFRKRPIHEIDGVLKECHSLAVHALKAPDSG